MMRNQPYVHLRERAKVEALAELFSDKARWTKGAFARDADGVLLRSDEETLAVSWCFVGGINHCGIVHDANFLFEVQTLLYGADTFIDLNDGRDGYRRVQRVIRETLRLDAEQARIRQ